MYYTILRTVVVIGIEGGKLDGDGQRHIGCQLGFGVPLLGAREDMVVGQDLGMEGD